MNQLSNMSGKTHLFRGPWRAAQASGVAPGTGLPTDEVSVLLPLKLILVGMSGVGKSAAGNTILRRKEFKSEISPSSLTLRSESREGEVCGRKVLVVDTPGLCNTEISEGKLKEEMQRALSLCPPGPHVFLLVIQLGRFTQQEKTVMETLQELFSKRVNQHTMVLFTYGDRLRYNAVEEFICTDTNLHQLVQKCGNRYHVFNNEDMKNSDQVKDLFKTINKFLENKSEIHYVKEEGNIKDEKTFSEDAQWFNEPEIGGILGAVIGGLIGGVTGVFIGAVLGYGAGKLWGFTKRDKRRR